VGAALLRGSLEGATGGPPETARALVESLPNGKLEILEGQSHDVAADLLGPALKAFFVG
jgi:hypothetical protein